MFKKICSIFLSFVIAFSFTISGSLESYAYSREKLNKSIKETAALMYTSIPEPTVGSIGGEWTVLSLARSGVKVPKKYYEDYYKRVVNKVKDCKGILHRMKFTEYSRVILALTAINKDVTDVGGYNLLSYLSDFDNVKKQGINGPIFALIAFDSGNYNIPVDKNASVQTTRQGIIDFILDKEIHKGTSNAGGWALSGTDPDPDVTFMAIQALSNYMDQKSVKEAVDRALEIMSKKQLSTGGFDSWGTANCESTAQAIVALTALGIDIDSDSRFIKTDSKGNKNTVIDGMMEFYCEDGGFAHVNEGYDGGGGSGTGLNAMATDQGMYALDAYYRFINGQNKLYDMTDAKSTLVIGDNPDLDKKTDSDNNSDDNVNNDENSGNNGNTNGNTNGNKTNQYTKIDNSGNKKYTSNINGKKVTTTENKTATISTKVIYSGEKDGLIPKNKKCVIIQFEKKEKEQIVEFKISKNKKQYLYYSKELSEKSGCATYIALFDTSVEKESLLKMDNYVFHKIQKEDANNVNQDADNANQNVDNVSKEEQTTSEDKVDTSAQRRQPDTEDETNTTSNSSNSENETEDYTHPEKYEIIFGDVNDDKVVNAQDVLDVQSVLSGKLDLTSEKQIIAINVSMDSKIDNGDIDQIIDNFISSKDYTIFDIFKDKKDKDSDKKSSDKKSNNTQKEDVKQNN